MKYVIKQVKVFNFDKISNDWKYDRRDIGLFERGDKEIVFKVYFPEKNLVRNYILKSNVDQEWELDKLTIKSEIVEGKDMESIYYEKLGSNSGAIGVYKFPDYDVYFINIYDNEKMLKSGEYLIYDVNSEKIDDVIKDYGMEIEDDKVVEFGDITGKSNS